MKVLLKLGGTLLEEAPLRQAIASQIVGIAKKHDVVVVHGGGRQVTQYLEQQGIESRFVNGLRVSDERVIEAVTRIIAGGVNKQLVAALIAAGGQAVGLSGIDGTLTKAKQKSADLGFVGEPQRSDPRLFNLLRAADYIPVVACIAGDEHGRVYNVNADQMAVSCAIGWQADCLFFLTDVPGVKGADGCVSNELRSSQIADLVAARVVHGGMQAKLEASAAALDAGVKEVVIAPGKEPEICQRLIAGEKTGTRILADVKSALGRLS